MQIWLSPRRFRSNWLAFRLFVFAGCTAWLLPMPGSLAMETTVELSASVSKSTLVAPLDPNQEIGVVLALPLSDPKGAAEFIQHISQKGDPLYHHYLTPQQFAQQFGGNSEDYAALKQWASTNGLKISQESVGRLNLTVRGSVSQWQKIFNTQINRYRAPDGSEFYSASTALAVPSAIAPKISGVIGLSGGKQYAPLFKIAKRLGESTATVSANTDKKPNAGGSGPGGSYSAKDLRIAYSIPAFGNLSHHAAVAVFEQGGFTASDVSEYLDTNDLPHAKVTPVSVDGSPTTVSNSNVELEAVLDIDMVIAINPSVDEVRVYEDSIDIFQTALLDAITQVGDENLVQVFSISYGQDEGYQGNDAIAAENTALQQLATEGITVTASSGDDGAYGDLYNFYYNVSDPASQPYITGVGGTTLYTGVDHAYIEEQAWNELASGDGATGGGISSYWSFPSFQGEPSTQYMTLNGGSTSMRNVPDVAALGDPLTGVGIYSKINGGWIQIGGTSVSSPIWAGYLSIIDAALEYTGLQNLGFFNPALYAVGALELGEADPAYYLYNITIGSNGDATLYPGYPGYSNGSLYSNTTGNGSIWGGGFAAQLMVSGTASGTAPGAIDKFNVVKTTNTTATLNWSASEGASGYVVGVYNYGTYGYPVEQSFITKDTTITVPDLVHGQDYWVYLWAFNGSGGSQPIGPFNFVPGSLSGGSGVEERVLNPQNPDASTNPEFGTSIAISGKTLVISEPQETVKHQPDVGEVHVYLEPPQGWGSDQRQMPLVTPIRGWGLALPSVVILLPFVARLKVTSMSSPRRGGPLRPRTPGC
jgi:subtilase family serine protease